MSRVNAVAAWLCTTLGLSLLVCSIALVPGSVALADDGEQCGGECIYNSGTTQTWILLYSHCETEDCACPSSPPGVPPPSGPGQEVITECAAFLLCVWDCDCPTLYAYCSGSEPRCATECWCTSNIFGRYCSGV
jgi:hypothetical protein